MGVHEFLCRGARVRVCDGRVEVLTKPAVCRCPYVEAVYKMRHINEEAVEEIVKHKMQRHGFCRPNRCFDDSLVVPFGSSEIIKVCMEEGLLDCSVTVCDGAGTVISWNPSLTQGIGARLNGIIRTSPINEVINHIESNGGRVLNPENALINQPLGVEKAISMGFKRIAVTVIGLNAGDIPEIRRIEGAHRDVKIAVFSTCNTLVAESDIPRLKMADIVCASASRLVRERVGPAALMQMGVSIPVFVLTEFGKKLALTYLMKMRCSFVAFRARMPYIVDEKQPVLG